MGDHAGEEEEVEAQAATRSAPSLRQQELQQRCRVFSGALVIASLFVRGGQMGGADVVTRLGGEEGVGEGAAVADGERRNRIMMMRTS